MKLISRKKINMSTNLPKYYDLIKRVVWLLHAWWGGGRAMISSKTTAFMRLLSRDVSGFLVPEPTRVFLTNKHKQFHNFHLIWLIMLIWRFFFLGAIFQFLFNFTNFLFYFNLKPDYILSFPKLITTYIFWSLYRLLWYTHRQGRP